jgi:hypothetical protein
MLRKTLVALAFISLVISAAAQAGPAVVPGSDLKKVVPETYFFRGLSATVQARNSAAVKYADGLFVIAALVDTSGYSTDIKSKYNGLFITEKTLSLGGKTIVPGEYGMGYTPEGKFHILDVAGNELAVADMMADSKLPHAVPLTITADQDGVRLYLGKKYVTITTQ